MDETTWKEILSRVKPLSISVAGLLSSAKPLILDDNKLILSVYYKFHKDKLEETKTRKMLEDIALNVLGKDIRIECYLEKTSNIQNKANLIDINESNIIKTAEELFA